MHSSGERNRSVARVLRAHNSDVIQHNIVIAVSVDDAVVIIPQCWRHCV